MGKFINEFKEFAVKGNAVDMAVGVIIGGAFGKIVTSIVNDIIMPPIGWLIGGVNFSDLKCELPTVKIGEEELAAATINYGAFIQTIINKLAKKKKKEEEKAPAAPPAPSKEELLLTEIRDLLKEKK